MGSETGMVLYSKLNKTEFSAVRQSLECPRTFFGRSNTNSETSGGFHTNRSCQVCGGSHGAWVCGNFKQLDVIKGGNVQNYVNCIIIV